MITIPIRSAPTITIPPRPEITEPVIERIAVKAADACKMLGVSSGTLTLWTKKGLIPHRRIGGRILYSVEGLKAFVDGSETE